MFNKCLLLGTVETKPHIHVFPTRSRVANFVLLTSEKWFDTKKQTDVERSQRHQIAVFSERLVALVEQFIHPGSYIYIEGQLENRRFTDPEGIIRNSVDVVVRHNKGHTITLMDGRVQEPDKEW